MKFVYSLTYLFSPLFGLSNCFVDTVASTVDSTKKAAESTFETGKTYIDSAKGNRRQSPTF